MIHIIGTDQSDAINAASRWYHSDNRRPFLLTGHAGTGKTTLAVQLADILAPGSTAFLAPTGKAAQVLTSKISHRGYTAHTIHSAIDRRGPGDGGWCAAGRRPGAVKESWQAIGSDVVRSECAC